VKRGGRRRDTAVQRPADAVRPGYAGWATDIVLATKTLTGIEKLVYLHIGSLDRPTSSQPGGCFEKDARSAERLGISREWYVKTRSRLARLGLLVAVDRAQGRYTRWFTACPVEYLTDLRDDAKAAWRIGQARQLDNWLARCGAAFTPEAASPNGRLFTRAVNASSLEPHHATAGSSLGNVSARSHPISGTTDVVTHCEAAEPRDAVPSGHSLSYHVSGHEKSGSHEPGESGPRTALQSELHALPGQGLPGSMPVASSPMAETEEQRAARLEANRAKWKAPRGWLAPFLSAWRAAYGGVPGGLADHLKPIHDELGAGECLHRWTRYITGTKAQYASPKKFAEIHGAYAGPEIQTMTDENGVERLHRRNAAGEWVAA
jgi:hypothetical protein